MQRLTLKEARKETGQSAVMVAKMAGCDRATLYRIESGQHQPKRETARKLYKIYLGRVSLASIYDPVFVAREEIAS